MLDGCSTRALARRAGVAADADALDLHAILITEEDTTTAGADRVGVLLCSRRFGELWMGFDTQMETGLAYGTNATQLQVAAGVLSGWSQLGRQKGIHFVEDLDHGAFMDTASEILGPPLVVHDEHAPPLTFGQRVRVPVGGVA